MFVYSLIYIVCWFIFFIYLFIFFFFIHFIVRLSRRHKLTRMYPPPSQKLICTPLCLRSNRTGNHHFLRGSLINLVPQQSPLLKLFAVRLCMCMSTNSWTYWWNMVHSWFSGSGISLIWSSRFGIESMRGRWDSRITLEIMGLHEISGSDYGTEEPYWKPSAKIGVLPTKNPGGTLTYHTSKSSNWRNKADLFILSGVLLDKEKLKAWLKKNRSFRFDLFRLRLSPLQNLVTFLDPTLQRLAGWQAIQSIHSSHKDLSVIERTV